MVKPSGSPIFDIRGLTVHYGHQSALSEVTLQIARDEVTSVIGPSGSGKTTLLQCLNRMIDLVPRARVSGQVLMNGTDVYGPSSDAFVLRCKVGMVLKQPSLFPNSIFENVAYGLRVHGWRDRLRILHRVRESLERTALLDEVENRLHEPASTLSAGQQQRLCIARALAISPEVLLMDEPAGALDPVATARIEDLIRQLRKSYSIIIETHNLQQAARVSDTTVFLDQGRLVEADETRRIFTNPARKETEDYVTGRFESWSP